MRYKLFFLIMAFQACWAQAQSEMSSDYTLLYKLDSASVQAYYHHESAFRLLKDARNGSTPDTCMAKVRGSCQLPHDPGAYLLVWTEQDDLKWKLAYRHGMSLDVRQRGNKVLIKLFDRYSLLPVKDAVIYYGKKPFYYDDNLEGYLLKKGSYLNKYQHSYLIHRNGNVVIASIDSYAYGYNRWSRFWYRFPYYFTHPFRRKDVYKGYLALNKPGLFRVGDTLKYKSAVFNTKGKPVKTKNIALVMSYYDPQKGYQEFDLPNVEHYDPGRIKGYFLITDSLEGKNASIFIANPRSKKFGSYRTKYFRKSFQINDYILDEIEFESELINDGGYISKATPLKIKLNARDHNDLPVLDGRVHITLSPGDAQQYNDETIAVIRDPLLDTSFALHPAGENLFKYFPENWPLANFRVQCRVVLSNSTHESHAEHYRLDYKPHQYPFTVEVKDGTIDFRLGHKGYEMPDSIVLIGLQKARHVGRYLSEYDTILTRELIQVPFSRTWNPAVDEYQVYANGELIKEMYNDLDRYPKQILGFEADSVLISFMHANIMPVLYEVYANGRKLVRSGICRGDTVRVSRQLGDYLVLRYHLHGESGAYTEVIPLKDFIRSQIVPLQAEANIPERVRPGEKKEIELSVSDSEGKAEADLDILAVAVKSSFDGDAVTELLPRPYYKKKIKHPKDRNFDVEFGSVYGDHFYAWGISRPLYEMLELSRKKAYQYMFLDEGLRLDTMSLGMDTENGQFAAFVYDSSSQFEVYAIYANGAPVYRYDMAFPVYSIPLSPGRYTIRLRCHDESLEVDSVMIYPGKKTELALNLARLPAGVQRSKEKNYFTKEEHENFAHSMIMIYGSRGTYTISQGDNWFRGNGSSYRRYGNFKAGPATYWSFSTDSLRFYLEPGHSYSFRENVVKQVPLNDSYVKTRLYRCKKYQFPGQVMHRINAGYNFVPRPEVPEFLPDNTGNTSTGLLKMYNRSDSIFNYFQLYHYDSELMYYSGYNAIFIRSFPPGHYRLQAYTASKQSVVIDSFRVNEDQTTYLWLQNKHFEKRFNFANLKTAHTDLKSETAPGEGNKALSSEFAGKPLILGTVQEAGSLESIPFANVVVKTAAGYIVSGGTADLDGSVLIRDILPGTYHLEISFTGYSTSVISHFKSL